MNDLKNIKSRNRMMIVILWLSFLFSLFTNYMTDNATESIRNFFFYFGIPVLFSLTFLTWKQFFPKVVMYLNVLGIVGFMWLLNLIDPHILNFIFFYFAVALSTLYQSKRLIYFTTSFVLIASGHIYYFSGNREFIFYNSSNADGLYVFASIIFITFTLLSQTKQSGIIHEEMVQKTIESETQREKATNALANIKDSAKAVATFSTKLNSNIKNTTELSNDITASAKDMSESFSDQNESIVKMKEAIESVDRDIQVVNQSSDDMLSYSKKTMVSTEEGNQELKNLEQMMMKVDSIIGENVLTMQQLMDRTDKIMLIVNVMNDISSQINLLSLNANIEAARAGEHGKGFSVVANEIKKLADNSRASAEDIKVILGELNTKANEAFESSTQGKEAIDISSEALAEVKTSFRHITENTNRVARLSESLQKLVDNLHSSSSVIVDRIIDNTTITEENMVSVHDMLKNIEKQNEQIQEIVRNFNKLEEQIQKFSVE